MTFREHPKLLWKDFTKIYEICWKIPSLGNIDILQQEYLIIFWEKSVLTCTYTLHNERLKFDTIKTMMLVI